MFKVIMGDKPWFNTPQSYEQKFWQNWRDEDISDPMLTIARAGFFFSFLGGLVTVAATFLMEPELRNLAIRGLALCYFTSLFIGAIIGRFGGMRAIYLGNIILFSGSFSTWVYYGFNLPETGASELVALILPMNGLLFIELMMSYAFLIVPSLILTTALCVLVTTVILLLFPNAWELNKDTLIAFVALYFGGAILGLCLCSLLRSGNNALIKERRLVQQQTQSKWLLQTTIETSDLGILAFDGRGNLALNQNVPKYFSEDFEFHDQASFEKILHDHFSFRTKALAEKGHEIQLGSEYFLLHKRRTYDLVVFTFFNITERHAWERKLRENQKLGLIGQLTSGIAHDYNNILAIALSSLEAFPAKDNIQLYDEYIQDAINALDHGKSVSHKLLSLTNTSSSNMRDFGIIEHLRSEQSFFEAAIEEKVQLRIHFSEEIYVHSDWEELRSAILNIVLNARNAIGDRKGEIDITMKKVDQYCQINISDNGPGIAPQHCAHLFDPFYTTRKTQYSSGLGLAMVKNFLVSSGGYIDFTTKPGKTCFSLYLPLAENQRPYIAKKRSASNVTEIVRAKSSNKELVLIVDDNELLLKSISKALEYKKIPYLVAHNANQAMAFMVMHGEEISTVFLDFSMPDMDGITLGEKLIAMNDRPYYYILTGNASLDVIKKAKKKGFVDVLFKPLKVVDMIDIVNENKLAIRREEQEAK